MTGIKSRCSRLRAAGSLPFLAKNVRLLRLPERGARGPLYQNPLWLIPGPSAAGARGCGAPAAAGLRLLPHPLRPSKTGRRAATAAKLSLEQAQLLPEQEPWKEPGMCQCPRCWSSTRGAERVLGARAGRPRGSCGIRLVNVKESVENSFRC